MKSKNQDRKQQSTRDVLKAFEMGKTVYTKYCTGGGGGHLLLLLTRLMWLDYSASEAYNERTFGCEDFD